MLAKIVDFQSKSKKATPKKQDSLGNVLSFLNRVSQVPEQTHDFKDGTTRIFSEVCAYTNWPIAHLYVRSNDDDDKYVSNNIWFLEDGLDPSAINEFKNISEETVFSVGKGLIGLIAQKHEANAVEDVTVLKQFLRADAARRSGVLGFFGFPVMSQGECVAVAEFYGREKGLLDETSLEIMQYVSAQLARLYEREQSKQKQERLLAQFENSVQLSSQDLVNSAKELITLGKDVRFQAQSNNEQCARVNDSRLSILNSMDSLQNAMVQLASVGEQTVQSNTQVNDTVTLLSQNVTAALEELQKLGELTANIEDIVSDVSEVSAQVRMLGLNASIEAARSGAAGKGFAIVASEIKSLAQQSEESSQEIGEKLEDIQHIANAGVKLMGAVNQSMATLEGTTMQLSDVVDNQHAATSTIRNSLDDAQGSFTNIDNDIESMTQASAELLDHAENVASHAEKMDTLSSIISLSSGEFIEAIKED